MTPIEFRNMRRGRPPMRKRLRSLDEADALAETVARVCGSDVRIVASLSVLCIDRKHPHRESAGYWVQRSDDGLRWDTV